MNYQMTPYKTKASVCLEKDEWKWRNNSAIKSTYSPCRERM